MANQTEESRRKRLKNQSKVILSNASDLSSGPNPNHPIPPGSTGTQTVTDLNNNRLSTTNHQDTSQLPRAQNERKRSNEIGTATGPIMKRFKWSLALALLLAILPCLRGEPPGNDLQNWDRPAGMPKITQLEVMCGAQHMEVHLNFDSPFHGLVASKGMYGQAGCVYVPPRSGRTGFVFNIYYDKCGTKPDNHGKFYENTIVVQYDEELIEAWDEAKRLRCEWFNDYEKTATRTSPMVISDLEIVELNFHGDNVDCWMEIQEGKGPWAPPLNGIVPLGSPLTMVVAVKDPTGEFDMRVKACEASDGHGGHTLQLSDGDGCILRPKLLGKFSKMKIDDGKATVLTYAYINAFKFPDMLNVHLRCTVEICRHGCPNHCSSEYALPPSVAANRPIPSNHLHNFLEPIAYESQNIKSFGRPNALQEQEPSGQHRQPEPQPPQHLFQHQAKPLRQNEGQAPFLNPPSPTRFHLQPRQRPEEPSVSLSPPPPLKLHQRQPHGRPRPPRPQNRPPQHTRQGHGHPYPPSIRGPPNNAPRRNRPNHSQEPNRQGLPHEDEDTVVNNEDRNNEEEDPDTAPVQNQTVPVDEENESPQPFSESNAAELKGAEPTTTDTETSSSSFPKGPRHLNLRKRRSVTSNSDVIGIQGAFRVISQADLNFALNLSSTPTPPSPAVLKGKILSAEPVYGVCLPRLGFGIVFFGLGLATLVAVLIASFFAYTHYRATISSKAGVMALGEGHPPGLSTQPVLPMVIFRHFW